MSWLSRIVVSTFQLKTVDSEEPVLKEYYYEGGIKSYVEHLNANKTVLFPEPIFIEGEQQEIIVEVALQYTDGYHTNLLTFANNIAYL